MADFFSEFWTVFISVTTLGGTAWLMYLLITNSKHKLAAGEKAESTGHEWDGIQELNTPLPAWWLWMFWITIIFSLVYYFLYPGLGSYKGYLNWSSAGEHAAEVAEAKAKYEPLYNDYASTDIATLAKNEKAMQTGGRLFANNCAICHGSDARGAKGFPNLTDNDWLYGGDPATIKTTIMNGRNGVMPGWHATLGDQGVKEVTSYVLSLSGREAPANEVEAGKARFAMCAGCHMPTGTGLQALGAPNLTDNIWLYGASRKAIEQTIAKGRAGVMPSFHGSLGEAKVHILAAYVYSLNEAK
jgi:cytochrome c oxidase cbb3-type subunit 3